MKIDSKIFFSIAITFLLLATSLYFIFLSNNSNKTSNNSAFDRMTEQGLVRGFASKHNTITWQGIPFALPPVGNLRWKSPQPPKKRQSILLANNNNTVCLQKTGSIITFNLINSNRMIGSEDCLYLNIVAPNNIKPDEKLPVMVWLHGGGRSKGDKGDKDYAGEHLAQQGRVILVNVNHRLGPIGWFLHPALVNSSDSVAEKSGNFGTLDIIESLKWTRANIQNFGGDPDNITLFGVSTGASNTLSLVLSPLAKGLFHKAIMQSGIYRPATQAYASLPYSEGGHKNSSSEIVSKILIKTQHASNKSDALSLQKNIDPQVLTAILKDFDAKEFIKLYDDSVSGMLNFPSLNSDGFVIPLENIETIFSKKENYNHMPMIFGSNLDENKIFMAFDLNFVSIPFGIRNPEKYKRTAKYLSENWRINAVDKIARAASESQDDIYAYRFDWNKLPKIGWIDFSELIGASHIFETPFIFTKQHKQKRKALSDAMISYWTNFAYSGSPNQSNSKNQQHELPEWSKWDNSEQANKFIILNTGDKGIKMSNEELFESDLKNRLRNDMTISDSIERCILYKTMFMPQDLTGFDLREYLSFDSNGCSTELDITNNYHFFKS